MKRRSKKVRMGSGMDFHPPPWKYNPSSWKERIPICILATIAFFISSYLALYQWGLISSVWDPFFGGQSQLVLSSAESERMWSWFGVPDAAMGAFAYLGDAVFGLAGSTRRWQYRPWLVLLFGLDVIPLGIVSAVLVGLQYFTVGSWCFLCLVTAVISLTLVYLAYDEVWSCLLYLREVWNRSDGWRPFWNTFWGRRTPEGDAASRAIEERARARSDGAAA